MKLLHEDHAAILLAPRSRVDAAFAGGLRPDPIQTLSEWSDAHMVLPSYASERGPFRTSRVPFMKEIMDCLSPSHPCQEVVLMKCVQIGGTQLAVNWAGFVVDRVPASMMLVEPTIDLAKKLSKSKIQHAFDDVRSIRGKVKEARARDSGNTILMKEFAGGMMVFAGANSGVSLRFLPARFLFLDEIDAYPQDVDGEGHPVELAENRTTSFARCKVFKNSTPLTKTLSVIEPAYSAGSRGRYHVPCPHCGHFQWLQWRIPGKEKNTYTYPMVFTRDEAGKIIDAQYTCEACRRLIPEHHKPAMLAKGQWVHEDPSNPIRSFHINILYQPYGWKMSWVALARTWMKAWKRSTRGDTRALKVFINTFLAETWEEKSEKFTEDELKDRKELYRAAVPAGAYILTGAADIQDDRIEVECVGWGLEGERWSVDYQRFMGSPAQKEVWDQLDAWIEKTFEHEHGLTLKMQLICVDTGGHHTTEAYKYIAKRQNKGLRAVKGSSIPGARLVSIGAKDKLTRVQLFLVGTDTAKDTLFANLKVKMPGPGYYHFPDHTDYDDEYFAQLTAEEKRDKTIKGVVKGHHYVKTRRRNEVLDLAVYNLAALYLLKPNLSAIAANWEAHVAKQIGIQTVASQPDADEEVPTTPARQSFPSRRKNFITGWR